MPIIILVLGFFSDRIQPNVQNQTIKLDQATKYVTNALTAIETVKCFTGEKSEILKYSYSIQAAASYYLRQSRYHALQLSLIRLSTLAMFVQGFWYGSTLINSGKKDPGQVLTTFWAALMATQGIQQILPHLVVLEKGRAAGARLRTIMAQMQPVEEMKRAKRAQNS